MTANDQILLKNRSINNTTTLYIEYLIYKILHKILNVWVVLTIEKNRETNSIQKKTIRT